MSAHAHTRSVEVLSPGPESTVQDTGRPGHLAIGLPPCGAQDNFALRMANLLVGNATGVPPLSLGDPGDAGLEVLLMGPRLRFHAAAIVAITGGAFHPKLDGAAVPMWQALDVPAGSLLELGPTRGGLRGYVAFDGGIQVPEYVGSRSTYVRGRLGGLDGRALKAGDHLALGESRSRTLVGRRLKPELIPELPAVGELRVVPGPQDDLFVPESVEALYREDWTLTPVADRMGFRFSGPRLTTLPRSEEVKRHAGSGPTDVVADVTPLGGIQVPGSGEVIAIGVEVPSVGGYAKIATVISADMGRLGQLRPGQRTRFVPVDLDTAVDIVLAQSALVDEASLIRG